MGLPLSSLKAPPWLVGWILTSARRMLTLHPWVLPLLQRCQGQPGVTRQWQLRGGDVSKQGGGDTEQTAP